MKDTLILGIESSCDETAASVVKNGGSSSTIPRTFSGEFAASQAVNNPPEE